MEIVQVFGDNKYRLTLSKKEVFILMFLLHRF